MAGDEASSPEDQMVEIRVAVADATGVHALVQRLASVFDRSSVTFDGRRKEVRVRSEPESRTVVLVLDAVEAWLAEDGVQSAKLSLGDRSYTMVSPVPDHGPPVMVARERGIRRRLLAAPAISPSFEGASTVAGPS